MERASATPSTFGARPRPDSARRRCRRSRRMVTMMRFFWRGTTLPMAAPIQSTARSVRSMTTSSTVMSTSAPHPSSAVLASVGGTATPKSTMIGPTMASAPTDATCNNEKVRMPEVEPPRIDAAPLERAHLRRRARGPAEGRGGRDRVADELRRRDQRERRAAGHVVVDQQSLQHPGEVEHDQLRDDQRDQPPPVDLDQLVRRRQHPEDRRREQVDDAAAEDPGNPLAHHATESRAVEGAQGRGRRCVG